MMKVLVLLFLCFFCSCLEAKSENGNPDLSSDVINLKAELRYNNEYYNKINSDLGSKINNLDSSLSGLKESISRIDSYSTNVMTVYSFLTWFIPLILAVLSLASFQFIWSRTKSIHKDAVDKWIKENELFLLDEAKKTIPS